MLKAYDWAKNKYPKEHRFMMRLWGKSWKGAPVLAAAAMAVIAIPALVAGFYVGKQFAAPTVNISNNIPAPDTKSKDVISIPTLAIDQNGQTPKPKDQQLQPASPNPANSAANTAENNPLDGPVGSTYPRRGDAGEGVNT
jgi:hypothetical protein